MNGAAIALSGNNFLSGASDVDLLSYRDAMKESQDRIKEEIGRIDAEFVKRHGERLEQTFEVTNKKTGTVSVDLDGDLKAKGEIKNTVKWDSDALRDIAKTMPWEQVQHYFKIVFTMSETIYKALPPGDLKDKVDAARTTTPGDLKVTVERVESKA